MSLRVSFFVALALGAVLACSDDDPPTVEQTLRERHVKNLSFIDVSGDSIAYLDAGDTSSGNTLVLLHGIPTSSFLYRNVAPEIAEVTGWRVVAFDLLGFGESAKPVRPGAYSIPAHATRVFDALSSLGVQSFVLGLHDIGGFVGWEMLASSPHRIRGLVVANTSAYADGLSPAPRVAEIVSGMKTPQEAWEQLSAPEFASMVAREFLEIGVAEPTALSDQLVAAYAGPLSEGSSEAFIEFFEGIGPVLMAESARRQTLQAFPGEALVIHGTLDRFFSVDAVAPLFQSDFSLPESRVVRVEGAGHYVQEDAPAEYVEAVVNFLGGF